MVSLAAQSPAIHPVGDGVSGETAEHSKYSIDPVQFCSVFEKIIEFK